MAELHNSPTEVVCEHCGHTWTEPYENDLPERCESCRHPYVRAFPLRILGNSEAAEEYSENVLRKRERMS